MLISQFGKRTAQELCGLHHPLDSGQEFQYYLFSILIHYGSNEIALHYETVPPICELCESLSKMKLISETVLDLPFVPDTPITLPDLHDLLL